MCFNDFTGLTELGWIAGTGVLLALWASLSVLPALLLWRDRNGGRAVGKKLHLEQGLAWDRKLTFHPYLALLLAACVSFLAWKESQKVSFDHNLLHLQNPKMESVRLTRELLETGEGSLIYGVVMADSVEQADELAAKLRELSTVSKVRTLGDLVPRNQKRGWKRSVGSRKFLEKLPWDRAGSRPWMCPKRKRLRVSFGIQSRGCQAGKTVFGSIGKGSAGSDNF